jgi:hypothetical protein
MYRVEKVDQMVYDCRTGTKHPGYAVIAPDGIPITATAWTFDVARSIAKSANLAAKKKEKEIHANGSDTTHN